MYVLKMVDTTYTISQKNIQGDIVRIFDQNGSLAASYVYDAWGNHKVLNPNGTENTSSTFIGNINPFRYRGYYYDSETSLYFLKSRYYDPELGRFITIDDISYLEPDTINGLNLYAYCGNNPVMCSDSAGCSSFWDSIGNWFNGVSQWINNNILQPIGNFFSNTIPNFFVDTVLNNGIFHAWNSTTNFFLNTVSDFFVKTVWTGDLSQIHVTSMSFLLKGSSLSEVVKNGTKMRFGNLLAASSSTKVNKFKKIMAIIGAVAGGIAMISSIVSLVFPPAAVVTVKIIAISAIVAVICLSLAGIKVELETF